MKIRPLILAVFLLLLPTGCTTAGMALSGRTAYPGYGVDRDVAEGLGCDLDGIEARADSVLDTMGSDVRYRLPPEGASHCEVLAHLGVPSNYASLGSRARMTWIWEPTYSASPYRTRGPTIYVNMIADGSGSYEVVRTSLLSNN